MPLFKQADKLAENIAQLTAQFANLTQAPSLIRRI